MTTLMRLVLGTAPKTQAMFISEFDFYQDHGDVRAPSGWQVSRWWPGPGSRAMAWIWRANSAYIVAQPTWEGRAGALRLRTRTGETDMTIIGVHCGHEEGLIDTLREARDLWRKRCRKSKVVWVGDWN